MKKNKQNIITLASVLLIIVILIATLITVTKDAEQEIIKLIDNSNKVSQTTSYKNNILIPTSISANLGSVGVSDDVIEEVLTYKSMLTDQELNYLENDVIQPHLDFYEGELQYYLEILNTNQILTNSMYPMYPASLAKLFLMGTIFQTADDGLLEIDDAIQSDLELMITISDNAAYNRLFYTLGEIDAKTNMFDYIDDFCRAYNFSDTIIHSLIELDEYDSHNYISDFVFESSASDIGKFLSLIYHGELINEDASEAMLNLLLKQERTGKIPYLLPENAVTANKTGELDYFSHDAAIVKTPACDYVLVIMTDSIELGYADDTILQELSLDIYKYLNR